MKTLSWTIYYDNREPFSSKDGEAKDAPTDGIQGIVEYFDNNTHIVHSGAEYYYWTGLSWAIGWQKDLERWLRRDLPDLKYGRQIDHELFLKIQKDIKKCQS